MLGCLLALPCFAQTVLEQFLFTDIVTWGHADEKFIVVVRSAFADPVVCWLVFSILVSSRLVSSVMCAQVGNVSQQQKHIFKTPAVTHSTHCS